MTPPLPHTPASSSPALARGWGSSLEICNLPSVLGDPWLLALSGSLGLEAWQVLMIALCFECAYSHPKEGCRSPSAQSPGQSSEEGSGTNEDYATSSKMRMSYKATQF